MAYLPTEEGQLPRPRRMMVDRVAQAIRVAHGDFGDYSPDELADYRETARVAIAAMREPTVAMVMAGKDIPTQDHEEEMWKAMIDAALSEEVK